MSVSTHSGAPFPDRNLIIYLGASLGNCMVPIGAPLLKQLAVQQTGLEPEALAERRRRALFALATLGENLKRFYKLSDEEKDAVQEQLASAQKSGHSAPARAALDYLRKRRAGNDRTCQQDLQSAQAEHQPAHG